LGSRTRRQTNEQTWNVFARQSIADEELFGRPGLGQLRDRSDAGVLLRSVRECCIRIRSGSRYLNLRRRFSRRGFCMSGAENPSPAEKDHQQYREKYTDHPDRRIVQEAAVRARPGNTGYLWHFCLVAVRWGLVRHRDLSCSYFCRRCTQRERACGGRRAKDALPGYCRAIHNTRQHRVVRKWCGTQPYQLCEAAKFVSFSPTLCY